MCDEGGGEGWVVVDASGDASDAGSDELMTACVRVRVSVRARVCVGACACVCVCMAV